ncbi:E3 SUMO-protein ligase KIAA1586-like [Glandiceps talaboti]
MLRNYLGLPTLPAKRRTPEETLSANREYDATKRKRTIVQSWKIEFKDWLVTDDSAREQKLYCKLCRTVYAPIAKKTQHADKYKKYSNGSFVRGSTNLRHEALKTHENSDGHKYAKQYLDAKNAAPGESVAERALQSMNTATIDKLSKLFRNAHALAKKSRPISDFRWQCSLDKQKGVDIGHTYHNDKSAQQFLVAISEVERAKIESKLSQARYCSLLSDGSTDVSVVENEIVYVHFARRGIPHCYFLGLIACEVANAQGIYNAIMKALTFKDLGKTEIQQKVVGFAGDGAAVNTGKINGVIAQMRNHISPAIVMVQCLSHRVELAFKDAMKKAPLYSKVYSLMDELFKFYHKSAKQSAGLKSSFEALNITPCTPTRVGGTRWLSHTLTALNNIWKGDTAIVKHLSQVINVELLFNYNEPHQSDYIIEY